MTPAEFETALARTKIQGKYARLARLVLVEGYTCPRALMVGGEASTLSNKSALRRAVATLRPYPPGWQSLTLTYPAEMDGEVKALAKRARKLVPCLP